MKADGTSHVISQRFFEIMEEEKKYATNYFPEG